MPMSSRFRKTLGIAALLGLVLLTGFFINAFYGNPVSALLARNTARQVLEEQFPGEPYTIESCGYNLKNGCYTVRVSREGSMDDWFDIDVEPDGTFRCIVEARDCTPEQAAVTEVNTGTYVFHVPALLRVLDLLNNNNAQGELYLTDVPALLKAQGLRVGLCDTCAPDEMLGVNTVEQLRQVELLLRAQG